MFASGGMHLSGQRPLPSPSGGGAFSCMPKRAPLDVSTKLPIALQSCPGAPAPAPHVVAPNLRLQAIFSAVSCVAFPLVLLPVTASALPVVALLLHCKRRFCAVASTAMPDTWTAVGRVAVAMYT